MKPSSSRGNVFVYLVVLMLIFGVLGVIITSLFTISTASSATPNDARQASYLLESALRYAFSELRNADPPFDPGVINTLNTTTYNLNPRGNFAFNLFAPWFIANETKAIPDGVTDSILLKTAEGQMPAAWAAKNTSNLWMINYEYLDLGVTSARNGIQSWAKTGDDTIVQITTAGDFVANKGERICLAVKLSASQQFTDGGDLYLHPIAKDFFPEKDGAININRIDYVYKRLIYEPADSRVKLETVSAAGMPNAEPPPAFPLDLDSNSDFIVLSPRNYFVIPTAAAGTVSVAGTFDQGLNIYDSATVKPVTRKADIQLSQYDLNTALKTIGTSGFVTIDTDAKTIDLGSGLDSGNVDFGAAWFKADMNVGGKVQVCSGGACEFGLGVRVFFTLAYSGTGDGLTFALISAANNTTSSIGGDIDLGELLGYAGDSRKVSNPTAATDFLDVAGAGLTPPNPGLHPPKIALEFDSYNNNTYQAYCDAGAIVDNNRNDPFSVEKDRDALQYVFWGHTSLAMPCRDYTIGTTHVTDHPTYDDNRHDVGEQEPKWTYTTSGAVRSTPALSHDGGTVYVGSDDGYLYAIDTVDGSFKWSFNTGGKVRSSPVVGPGGEVYVGSQGPGGAEGSVYSFNPANGSVNWKFTTPNNVDSSPAIGADDTVYIGDNHGNFYALNPGSRLADPNGDKTSLNPDNEWEFTDTGFNITSKGHPAIGPALDIDPTGTLQKIYITSSADSTLFALDPADGSIEWTYNKGEYSRYMPAADPVTGVVYTEKAGGQIIALSFDGTNVDTEWYRIFGTDHFTPVVKNGIVYAAGIAESSAGKLTAFASSDGVKIWNFFESGNLGQVQTTPAIAPDGTIYFASKDGLLYAVNPSGSKKWTFPIPINDDDNAGYSSPTVASDGTVYIGSSSDGKLYAINDYAVPRNIKQNYVTSVLDDVNDTVGGETVTLDSDIDWLTGAASAGPWAVRLEVMRSLVPNADAKYKYTLHAWIRQCDSTACGNIFGTFYADTRIAYTQVPHLVQKIELPQTEHDDFAAFIFGFTGASGQGTYQNARIADLKLSFIRKNDPRAGD